MFLAYVLVFLTSPAPVNAVASRVGEVFKASRASIYTQLHYRSVLKSDIKTTRKYLALGAYANWESVNGTHLLMTEITKLLIEYDADVNARDALGKTMLMRAAERGNLAFV